MEAPSSSSFTVMMAWSSPGRAVAPWTWTDGRMAEDVYDVIICGAGSGGGFLAGEIAPYGSVLILDAGPSVGGAPNFGFGSPQRRKFSTQINLGQYQPDNTFTNRGTTFFAYPMYMIESNQINASVQREPRVV